jgi:signal transduction histidine kinase
MVDQPTTTKDAGTAIEGGFFRDINVEFLIHELKDPISVIETAVRMLLEKPEKYGALTERQHRTLKRALRNSKRARSLLADLLEVGRSETGCFRCCRFDPVATVEEVVMEALEAADVDLWERMQAVKSGADRLVALGRHGIRCTHSNDIAQTHLCQDETKFRQIVGNLIKNGLQYRRQRLDVRMHCQQDHLVIDVVDDGPGVEKENRELIFERYARLKECVILSRTGHGLGLAGARILARYLGGDIIVKRGRDTGAAFCLRLPLHYSPNP